MAIRERRGPSTRRPVSAQRRGRCPPSPTAGRPALSAARTAALYRPSSLISQSLYTRRPQTARTLLLAEGGSHGAPGGDTPCGSPNRSSPPLSWPASRRPSGLRRGRLSARPRPLRRARRDAAARHRGERRGGAREPALPARRPRVDGRGAGGRSSSSPTARVVRLDQRSKLDYAGHEEGQDERIVLRLWSGSALVRVRSRGVRPVRDRDAGRHGPGARARDRAGRRRRRRDAAERLRGRGGARRRPAPGPAGRRRAHLRALGRRGRGAPALRPRRGRRVRPLGRPARVRGPAAPRGPPSTSPTSSTPYAGEFESNGTWQYEGTVGLRLDPPRRGRLAALLERPVDLDALRLDLGPLRALGLGPVPLRPLGLLGVARLVLGAGPHLGPGLGELGSGRRLRGLVPARLARPAGPRRGAATAATRSRGAGTATATAGTSSARATWAAATSGGRRVALDRLDPGALRAGGLARLPAHPRRARPPRERRRPARDQPPDDAGRLRARAGCRQPDHASPRPGPAATGLPRRAWTGRATARSGATTAGSPAPGRPPRRRALRARAGPARGTEAGAASPRRAPRPAPWYTPDRAGRGRRAPDRGPLRARRGREPRPPRGTYASARRGESSGSSGRAAAATAPAATRPRSSGEGSQRRAATRRGAASGSGSYRPRSGGDRSAQLPAPQQRRKLERLPAPRRAGAPRRTRPERRRHHGPPRAAARTPARRAAARAESSGGGGHAAPRPRGNRQ